MFFKFQLIIMVKNSFWLIFCAVLIRHITFDTCITQLVQKRASVIFFLLKKITDSKKHMYSLLLYCNIVTVCCGFLINDQ